MLQSTRPAFIEPCLPSPADQPPGGPNWLHEIKHDGYRLMARRDPVGIRLLTRNGHDWSPRYPLIVQAVNMLKVRSCLIDGEAVACDDNGMAVSCSHHNLHRLPCELSNPLRKRSFSLSSLNNNQNAGSDG